MKTKNYILTSIRLTLVLLTLCCVVYPAIITGAVQMVEGKGKGKGVTVTHKGQVVGYEGIGQSFTDDKYFWSRPSAVGYNAAGSGGSNKAPTNPDYLAEVQARIDTFLAHNPGIEKTQIPADLVTASGSGLDPDISIQAAQVQVPRIARIRGLSESDLLQLIENTKEGPFLGCMGPQKVSVLRLNIALDAFN